MNTLLFLFGILPMLTAFDIEEHQLPLCPDYLQLYSAHNLKPPPFEISATGLYKWPRKGNQD